MWDHSCFLKKLKKELSLHYNMEDEAAWAPARCVDEVDPVCPPIC